MNTVHLVGNIGKDPELKYIGQESTAVCECTLATYKYMGKDKDKGTDWHNLTIWGRRGELFAEWVFKGSKVAIKGSLDYQTFKDKETGENRWVTKIRVDEFEVMNSKTDKPNIEVVETEDKEPANEKQKDLFGSDDVPF